MQHRAPLVLSVVLATIAGCTGKLVDPWAMVGSVPRSSSVVVPGTPQALMDAFAQANNERDPARYSELFTGDYEFAFAVTDSAGNAFPGRRLLRDQELTYALHLFVTGTSSSPPATRIVLTLDRSIFPEPDSRPGKDFPWHQEVKENYVLAVDTIDQSFRLVGSARFFIVRGDSAQIPPDLAARGFRPDPNRWWIERWEDESAGTSGSPQDAPTPVKDTTWGDLKWLYLGP